MNPFKKKIEDLTLKKLDKTLNALSLDAPMLVNLHNWCSQNIDTINSLIETSIDNYKTLEDFVLYAYLAETKNVYNFKILLRDKYINKLQTKYEISVDTKSIRVVTYTSKTNYEEAYKSKMQRMTTISKSTDISLYRYLSSIFKTCILQQIKHDIEGGKTLNEAIPDFIK